jgi:ubiquinone/menaquinone biosynthesis C-methylase UbiE
MTVSNWWNRTRYGLYAPVYDWGAQPLERGRKRAIERLDIQAGDRVLIPGCGTGMDLEHLPAGVEVTAIDVTPAMVRRTDRRGDSLGLDVDARVGDARSLSFEDDTFDVVLLHLILSVIPNPKRVLAKTARVLNSEGRVSIYDKFVPEGTKPSLLRRAINPVARFLFADLTRRLEPMTADTDLELSTETSFLGGIYTVTIAAPSCGESSNTTENV